MRTVKVFSASWCAPCQALKAKLTESNIAFEAIDIEDNDELCQQLGIRSVPTTIIEGADFRHVGSMTTEVWDKFLRALKQ